MKTPLARLLFALLAALAFNASAVTRYVNLNSPSPTPPYTNWLTAATNIQDAVNAAVAGDTVLVTNGVYLFGGSALGGLTNRVTINKAVNVQSVNGASATMIQGFQVPGTTNGNSAVRCVWLTNGASLSGFTLTNGATLGASGDAKTTQTGGGAYCLSTLSVVSNCILAGNAAYYAGGGSAGGTLNNCALIRNAAAFQGGGSLYSTLNNCALRDNSSAYGGGAFSSTLNSCTLAGNSASQAGGGAYGCNMKNCIAFYNAAPTGKEYALAYGATINSTCTSPLPSGVNNITNEPAFVDFNTGNLHLQAGSPCINAGNNAYVTTTKDLDGNPRISGGTVDIGAYEFQSPTSVLSYAWAQQNGLPTDGSADFTDADGDGANNWHEWRADTVPTNAVSALLMGTATNGVTGLVVSWASVATRSYWLERSTNLGAVPPFQTIGTNLAGIAGTKTFNDTSATNGGPYFYRVGVQ